MEKSQTITLKRNVVNDTTVVSQIKNGNTVVNVKSVFCGTRNICDVLFEIAKEKMNQKQH